LDTLDVGAGFHVSPTEGAEGVWFPICSKIGVMALEYHARKMPLRWARDGRILRRVRRQGRTVLDEHAGFFDLFVPVGREVDAYVTLVAGPFARERATNSEVRRKFSAITGRPARPSDPALADYLRRTLTTLTLEGEVFQCFHRLLECFAALAYGAGNTEALAKEVYELQPKVLAARSTEDMWTQTHDLLAERARPIDPGSRIELARVGLERFPEHVLVGLVRDTVKERDPIDSLIARDAFQRANVELARERGHLMCGKHGTHGVVFLVDDPGAGARQKRGCVALAERVSRLARRFGLELHAGLVLSDKPSFLSYQYRRALASAEQALAQRQPLCQADRAPQPVFSSLRVMRRDLARAVTEAPATLERHFEGFLEAVRVHCGFQLESASVHLAVAFDDVVNALEGLHVLDPTALDELALPAQNSAQRAETLAALEDTYRRAIANAARVLERPSTAQRELGLQRAIEYARDHLSESLGITKIARLAGCAPRHFTETFRVSQGTTFHRYVLKLRLERAQSMLRSTSLSAERIAPLVGFGTREQFHRIFKRTFSMTPQEFRARHR
jgi:AraC-like DNA-binding protein